MTPTNLPSSSHTVTCFEDLANETFYEVFEYLDGIDSYEIFFNLNKRFQNLFLNSSYLIKIKLSSISKTTFQSYFQNIIIPYQHHIQSLYLSNPFIIDHFLTSDGLIQRFTHLRAFTIEDIESRYLATLLNALSVLPNLSTLVIICKQHHIPNRGHLYKQIFQLSALKYCRLSLNISNFFEYVHREGSDLIPSSLCSSNGTNTFSPITHLVIEDTIVLDEFSALLSYLPQLRHLSIKQLCGSSYSQPNIAPIISQHLTHVSLNLGNLYFDVFEFLLKNILHKVQVLHLSTPADQTYLSANRWESLIPLHMPYLRIFSIEQRVHTNRGIGETYVNLIDQFRSSFWTERQWFFASHAKFMEEACEMYFYSTDPYRKRRFTLDSELTKTTTPPNKELQMSFVHALELGDEKCAVNWTKYFPNVTQLTLKEDFLEERNYISPIILRQILPLKQITELHVYLSNRYFNELIQLLLSLPNIYKFNLHRTAFEKDSQLLRSDDSVLAMSTTNQIKDVTLVLQQCAFENMKLLVNLFPQMQHLTLHMAKDCLVEIVLYLLDKNNKRTPRLNSIYLKSLSLLLLEKITAELRSEKMRPVEIVTEGHHEIRLWW